jgi:hypothetical protein
VSNIYDLNVPHKVLVRDIPDPLGTVAQHDFLLGAALTALPSFGVDPATEQCGSFYGLRMGPPLEAVVVWVNTQRNFISRVRGGWPGTLLARPCNSARTTGTCVPSNSTYRCDHAPHAGRVFGSLHIQRLVQRALSARTMRADGIGTFDRYGPTTLSNCLERVSG